MPARSFVRAPAACVRCLERVMTGLDVGTAAGPLTLSGITPGADELTSEMLRGLESIEDLLGGKVRGSVVLS